MSSLQPADIENLREELRRRRTKLIGEIRGTLDQSAEASYADLAGQIRDVGDESVADVLLDAHLSELEHDTDEMRAIRDALGRIESDEYGICIDCGNEIIAERLYAQPTAERCIRCQEVWERLHGEDRPPEI